MNNPVDTDTEAMRHRARLVTWARVLLTVLVLAAMLVMLLWPGPMPLTRVLWLWVALLAAVWVAWSYLGRSRSAEPEARVDWHPLDEEEEPAVIPEVLEVRSAGERAGVLVFRGRLREPAEAVYQKLKQSFEPQMVPLLQQDEGGGSAIYLMPRRIEEEVMETPARTWVNWLLFVLTILTTTWVGAAHAGVDLLKEPWRFTAGLPYSIGLLSILGVHELGHFFAARRHGMNVTPPYFIPVPFALGTFGAFIKMRSPAEDRRSLFDVAVSGPLAGLVVAIPALLIGLQSSAVVPLNPQARPEMEASILFGLLAKLALGPALHGNGVLALSPLAFAGWLGLFITALNLLPIGQLDGGHIARSMFGTRVGGMISSLAMWGLFFVALLFWPGLMMWAIIVFFLAGRPTPPLNDLTPITPRRQWLGWFAYLILALILIPMPHSWW
jgi:membrane-associated protease RseP (regulator of RpoE activity)